MSLPFPVSPVSAALLAAAGTASEQGALSAPNTQAGAPNTVVISASSVAGPAADGIAHGARRVQGATRSHHFTFDPPSPGSARLEEKAHRLHREQKSEFADHLGAIDYNAQLAMRGTPHSLERQQRIERSQMRLELQMARAPVVEAEAEQSKAAYAVKMNEIKLNNFAAQILNQKGRATQLNQDIVESWRALVQAQGYSFLENSVFATALPGTPEAEMAKQIKEAVDTCIAGSNSNDFEKVMLLIGKDPSVVSIAPALQAYFKLANERVSRETLAYALRPEKPVSKQEHIQKINLLIDACQRPNATPAAFEALSQAFIAFTNETQQEYCGEPVIGVGPMLVVLQTAAESAIKVAFLNELKSNTNDAGLKRLNELMDLRKETNREALNAETMFKRAFLNAAIVSCQGDSRRAAAALKRKQDGLQFSFDSTLLLKDAPVDLKSLVLVALRETLVASKAHAETELKLVEREIQNFLILHLKGASDMAPFQNLTPSVIEHLIPLIDSDDREELITLKVRYEEAIRQNRMHQEDLNQCTEEGLAEFLNNGEMAASSQKLAEQLQGLEFELADCKKTVENAESLVRTATLRKMEFDQAHEAARAALKSRLEDRQDRQYFNSRQQGSDHSYDVATHSSNSDLRSARENVDRIFQNLVVPQLRPLLNASFDFLNQVRDRKEQMKLARIQEQMSAFNRADLEECSWEDEVPSSFASEVAQSSSVQAQMSAFSSADLGEWEDEVQSAAGESRQPMSVFSVSSSSSSSSSARSASVAAYPALFNAAAQEQVWESKDVERESDVSLSARNASFLNSFELDVANLEQQWMDDGQEAVPSPSVVINPVQGARREQEAAPRVQKRDVDKFTALLTRDALVKHQIDIMSETADKELASLYAARANLTPEDIKRAIKQHIAPVMESVEAITKPLITKGFVTESEMAILLQDVRNTMTADINARFGV